MQSAEHNLHMDLETKFSAWFVLYEIQDTLYRSGHSFRTKGEGSREAEAEGAESKFQSYQELSPGSRASFASSNLNQICPAMITASNLR
jgi:hypothetical protein